MGSRQRDFMFCEICGTMLSFDSPIKVTCPVCNHEKRIKDIAKAEIRYTLSAERAANCKVVLSWVPFASGAPKPKFDVRRELGVSSLEVSEEEKELKQMDYNAKCKVCQHLGMSYVARQIRSADEGQTIFYTCPVCASRQTENS